MKRSTIICIEQHGHCLKTKGRVRRTLSTVPIGEGIGVRKLVTRSIDSANVKQK